MKLLTYTEPNYEIAIGRELGRLVMSVRVGRRRKRSEVDITPPRHPVPQAVADVLTKAGLDPAGYFFFSCQMLRIGALPAIQRFVAVSRSAEVGHSTNHAPAVEPATEATPSPRREDIYRLAQSYAKSDVPARSEVGMRALRMMFNGGPAHEAHALLSGFAAAPQAET